MSELSVNEKSWIDRQIRHEENERYMVDGRDFVDEGLIWTELEKQRDPDPARVRDIIAKSLSLKRLEPSETAALLNCTDEDLWQEMHGAGLKVKQSV